MRSIIKVPLACLGIVICSGCQQPTIIVEPTPSYSTTSSSYSGPRTEVAPSLPGAVSGRPGEKNETASADTQTDNKADRSSAPLVPDEKQDAAVAKNDTSDTATKDSVTKDSPPQLPVSEQGPYLLQPGDRLELMYTDQWPIQGDYALLPGDRVRIEYLHLIDQEKSLDRTVQVQPDGKLSLPYIGIVAASGKTLAEFSEALNTAYDEFYVDPQIHVSLADTGAGLRGLWESIRSSGSRLVTVSPDGVIGVPFLGAVQASGLTLQELQDELQAQYNRVAKNLSITVRIAKSKQSTGNRPNSVIDRETSSDPSEPTLP